MVWLNYRVFFSVSKVICLWENLRIQNMSWDWCFHFTKIEPVWDLVLKKFHNHSVIISLWRLRMCIIAKISKIHWKSMIKKHQYFFAYISAMKARIFILCGGQLLSFGLIFQISLRFVHICACTSCKGVRARFIAIARVYN